MDDEKNDNKIILSKELQINILKFFLKTSIPRKIEQERIKKALSENEGQK